MDRRKFLASIVGLGTVAVISPQLFITKKKKKVEKRWKEEDIVSKFDIDDENTVEDFVVGYVKFAEGKEIIVTPFSVIEEFPALKKGDQGIIISNIFPEGFPKTYAHEEEDFLHKVITIGEDIPAMGPGSDITLLLGEDEKYLSLCKQWGFEPEKVKPRLYDTVLFPIKL